MTQPGFYTDPADPSRERFWDGDKWAEQTRPSGSDMASGRQRTVAALLDAALVSGVAGLLLYPLTQVVFFQTQYATDFLASMRTYSLVTPALVLVIGLLVFAVAGRVLHASPGQQLVGIAPLDADGDMLSGGRLAWWALATGGTPAAAASAIVALLLDPMSDSMMDTIAQVVILGVATVAVRLAFRLLGSVTAPLAGGRWLGELASGTTLTRR